MWVWSLDQEDSLEEEMATHASILAWRTSMDRGAWWATVHGVLRSWTWLKWLSMQSLRKGAAQMGSSAPLGGLWHPLPSQWTWAGSMEALPWDCQRLQATHPPPWGVLILSLGWALRTKSTASPNTSWLPQGKLYDPLRHHLQQGEGTPRATTPGQQCFPWPSQLLGSSVSHTPYRAGDLLLPSQGGGRRKAFQEKAK